MHAALQLLNCSVPKKITIDSPFLSWRIGGGLHPQHSGLGDTFLQPWSRILCEADPSLQGGEGRPSRTSVELYTLMRPTTSLRRPAPPQGPRVQFILALAAARQAPQQETPRQGNGWLG